MDRSEHYLGDILTRSAIRTCPLTQAECKYSVLKKPLVFVSAHGEQWQDSLHAIIRVLQSLNVDYYVAQDIPFSGEMLICKICRVISECSLVIALSNRSPNVLFEIGLAMGRGKPVIALSPKHGIRTDVSALPFIEYNNIEDIEKKLPKILLESPEFLLCRGKTAIKKGDSIAGASYLQKAIKLARTRARSSSTKAEILFLLGRIYSSRNELDKAIRYYTKASELIPTSRSLDTATIVGDILTLSTILETQLRKRLIDRARKKWNGNWRAQLQITLGLPQKPTRLAIGSLVYGIRKWNQYFPKEKIMSEEIVRKIENFAYARNIAVHGLEGELSERETLYHLLNILEVLKSLDETDKRNRDQQKPRVPRAPKK